MSSKSQYSTQVQGGGTLALPQRSLLEHSEPFKQASAGDSKKLPHRHQCMAQPLPWAAVLFLGLTATLLISLTPRFLKVLSALGLHIPQPIQRVLLTLRDFSFQHVAQV